MKILLRVTLMPILFLFRLVLGTAAFAVTVSSAVIGLSTSIFAILAVVEFCLGYWQNGFMLTALTLLVSPIGIPMVANWILDRLGDTCAFIEGHLC